MVEQVAVTRRASEKVRAGHLWVYRSDLVGNAAELTAGGLVTVVDGRGIPLGTAIYSSASEICLRMVSKVPGLGREGYLADVRTRVEAAIALRESVAAEAFSASVLHPTHDDETVMDGAPGRWVAMMMRAGWCFRRRMGCRGLWWIGMRGWWWCSC